MMNLIDYEIEEVQKLCENIIENSKLVTCMKTLVRVEIKHSISKQIVVCLRFPDNYPSENILVELKSKMLGTKFLNGLTKLCEQKARESLEKPQILTVLKFINFYFKENPLCVVYDEIAGIKKMLGNNDEPGRGELKLRQKNSAITLVSKGGPYYFKAKISIPEDYPNSCVSWDSHESNLPNVLVRFLNGQAREIARQCVEAPIRLLTKQNAQQFTPKPSLEKTLTFIIEATTDFHVEICPICKKKCLPDNADDVTTNDTRDSYIERVYCGHIYHQGCLKKYVREPPFPPGGKLCPAMKKHPRSDGQHNRPKQQNKMLNTKKPHIDISNEIIETCSIRLSHDRWGLNVKLAEARWAQQQARERELEEVKDFLQ